MKSLGMDRERPSVPRAVVAGAVWTFVVSGFLASIVAIREVDFNILNLFTIVGCAVVAVVALLKPKDLGLLSLALAFFALPALFGGFGLLYGPTLIAWLSPQGARNARAT